MTDAETLKYLEPGYKVTNEITDLNESEEAEMIRKRKMANRQQSIAMAARMKNIRTAVTFDIPDELDRLVNSFVLIVPVLFA